MTDYKAMTDEEATDEVLYEVRKIIQAQREAATEALQKRVQELEAVLSFTKKFMAA